MKKLLLGLILFYRKYLSPLKSSQYGLEAVERFGFVKGGFLIIWRILRCNPFSKGGYDPVPAKKSFKTFYKF